MALFDDKEEEILYGNEISIEIDRLTDCLVERKTQICYNTIYELVDSPISKKKQNACKTKAGNSIGVFHKKTGIAYTDLKFKVMMLFKA